MKLVIKIILTICLFIGFIPAREICAKEENATYFGSADYEEKISSSNEVELFNKFSNVDFFLKAGTLIDGNNYVVPIYSNTKNARMAIIPLIDGETYKIKVKNNDESNTYRMRIVTFKDYFQQMKIAPLASERTMDKLDPNVISVAQDIIYWNENTGVNSVSEYEGTFVNSNNAKTMVLFVGWGADSSNIEVSVKGKDLVNEMTNLLTDKLNRDNKATQNIMKVANSYWNHRDEFIYCSGTALDQPWNYWSYTGYVDSANTGKTITKENAGYKRIDCSTFVRYVINGIEYHSSPYYNALEHTVVEQGGLDNGVEVDNDDLTICRSDKIYIRTNKKLILEAKNSNYYFTKIFGYNSKGKLVQTFDNTKTNTILIPNPDVSYIRVEMKVTSNSDYAPKKDGVPAAILKCLRIREDERLEINAEVPISYRNANDMCKWFDLNGYALEFDRDNFNIDDLRIGSVIYWGRESGTWAYKNITHVSLYIGDGYLIHVTAPYGLVGGETIVIETVENLMTRYDKPLVAISSPKYHLAQDLHEHIYESDVVGPTCISNGYTTYICECGDSYKDNYVNPLDHIFDDCHKEDKKISRTCKRCGEIEEFKQLSLPTNYSGTIILTDKPENLYVGTHNIAEVLNIKEGTFTNGEITIQIDGTNIQIDGTTTKTVYFDLQTGEFKVPNYTRNPGYTLSDGNYRFGIHGNGINMPTFCIRNVGGVGNALVASNSKRIINESNVNGDHLGVPYLYFPNGTYEYEGNFVLFNQLNSSYDHEISKIDKITETGEIEVDGYLWSSSNDVVYGDEKQSGYSKEHGKIIYSNNTLNIYLPQEEGFLQIQMNLVDSKAINAYGWRLNMMYACDNQFNILFPVTQGGEYETAITIEGRDDFMGMGAHGSEIMTEFNIQINGNKVNLNELKTFTDFCSIQIERKSNFYDPLDEITHVANHEVTYDFDLNGFTVSQSVEWLKDVTCKSSYMAMFPVRRKYNQLQVSDTYFDDYDSTEYDVSESGFKTYPTKWTHGASKLTLYSKQSGVTATLELLESTQCTGTGYKHIANNDSYNKMYFTIVGVGNTKHDVKASDIWTTKSRYEVKLEEGIDKCNIYGHTFNNYVSDSNATYLEDGTKTSKCEHCDETNTIIDEGTKILLGDIDGNGKINQLDRVVLSRYLAKWNGYESINPKNADVNLDGKVNQLDRLILSRHLAKWQGYETLPQ